MTHGSLVSDSGIGGTVGASYYETDINQGANLSSAAPVVPITTLVGASPYQSKFPTAGNNGTTPPDFDNGKWRVVENNRFAP